MKTMIEVYRDHARIKKAWISMDVIDEIIEEDGECWIITSWNKFLYEGTVKELAFRTHYREYAGDRIRLIRMERERENDD